MRLLVCVSSGAVALPESWYFTNLMFPDKPTNEMRIKVFQENFIEEINLGDFTYLSNSRQISLVKKAVEISKNLEDALNNDVPIDLLEIDIKEICEILGEIIGESYDDKLIDTLFSNFCLGK